MNSKSLKPRQWLKRAAAMFLMMGTSLVMAQAPAKTEPESNTPGTQYRIRVGDKMSIKFLYHPEYNVESILVRPDGSISLLMIGDVLASGKTIQELQATIEKDYREHLLDPVVTVNLMEFVAPRIYIGGQVGKPGSYELRAGKTLIQMIFVAGGFTKDSNRKMVLHARPQISGDMTYHTYDVEQMLSANSTRKDLALEDGDYIFVPDSKMSKTKSVIEVFKAFIPSFGIGIRY